jgi:hypothetical protein
MSAFKPTSDERDLLKKAVAKYAHDPVKSQLLSRLGVEDSEFGLHGEEWKNTRQHGKGSHFELKTFDGQEARRFPPLAARASQHSVRFLHPSQNHHDSKAVVLPSRRTPAPVCNGSDLELLLRRFQPAYRSPLKPRKAVP